MTRDIIIFLFIASGFIAFLCYQAEGNPNWKRGIKKHILLMVGSIAFLVVLSMLGWGFLRLLGEIVTSLMEDLSLTTVVEMAVGAMLPGFIAIVMSYVVIIFGDWLLALGVTHPRNFGARSR